MQIRAVEIPIDLSAPLAHGNARLMITVDEETLIAVDNYGHAEFSVTVANISKTNPDYDPAAILAGIEGYAPGASFWGMALVWAEPTTIAHLVINVLHNQ
jgi:hypothetical protein